MKKVRLIGCKLKDIMYENGPVHSQAVTCEPAYFNFVGRYLLSVLIRELLAVLQWG